MYLNVMKKIKIELLSLLFLTIGLIFMRQYVFEVKIEIATGPEFVIMDNEVKVKDIFGNYPNTNYSRFYTDIETTSDNGIELEGNYFIWGEFCKLKKEQSSSKLRFIELKKCRKIKKNLVLFLVALCYLLIIILIYFKAKSSGKVGNVSV